MQRIIKFIFILATSGLPFFASGSGHDTIINDTILLSRDKIQSVELICYSSGPAQAQMINSQKEFNKFFERDCHTTPDIDFSTKTLLYFPTSTYGCKAPTFIRAVKIIGTVVIYQVSITVHGGCDINIINTNCVVVPKINPTYTINFEKTETFKND